MARRCFDSDPRRLFDEVQIKISEINGKLLNPKVNQKEKLINIKNNLRAESLNLLC
jgi:hypothetical protein